MKVSEINFGRRGGDHGNKFEQVDATSLYRDSIDDKSLFTVNLGARDSW